MLRTVYPLALLPVFLIACSGPSPYYDLGDSEWTNAKRDHTHEDGGVLGPIGTLGDGGAVGDSSSNGNTQLGNDAALADGSLGSEATGGGTLGGSNGGLGGSNGGLGGSSGGLGGSTGGLSKLQADYDSLMVNLGCQADLLRAFPAACEPAGVAYLTCLSANVSLCSCDPLENSLDCEPAYKSTSSAVAPCAVTHDAFGDCLAKN